jgi:nucleoid-associated protein YgaU
LIAFAVGVVPTVVRAQQPSMRPATHTVKRGDTLWDISKLYLGDPFLWPEIYRINSDLIEDPHWIYPGELLKLPTPAEPVTAEAQPARVIPPTTAPVTVRAGARAESDSTPPQVPQVIDPPKYVVRVGEYAAAPWVDRRGGPAESGYVISNRDLPGIASADQSHMNLYDQVLVAPPQGSDALEHQLYLAYRVGPLIENFGQIVIPTGVVQITRSTRNGEAAIGRVVKLFNEMLKGQRLIPYDSAAALVVTRPVPVEDGPSGKVRWIYGSPVVPTVQSYVVLDIAGQNIATGEQIELYKPRKPGIEPGDLATPELPIGRAQVLRVTPFGASAIVTWQQQPTLEEGTAARVAAKMP